MTDTPTDPTRAETSASKPQPYWSWPDDRTFLARAKRSAATSRTSVARSVEAIAESEAVLDKASKVGGKKPTAGDQP